VSSILDGKVILITGGTGSFGRAFARRLLENYHPKVIRIYSRGENLQHEMQEEFRGDIRLRFFIGDVRDKDRLSLVLRGVDIIVHAAALKEVVSCEYNPFETVKTNIIGTMNLIEGVLESNVERVIALSTDKAVQAVNSYGKSKAVMESLMVQANAFLRSKFSCTRYGNVEGSSRSVVPLWRRQRETGEITLTDTRMTRFWITVDEGVDFVIKSLEIMKGGEIFVPKLPWKSLVDKAKEVAPEARIKIVGIKPGEKLEEVLLTPEEARHSRDMGDYYLIEPEFPFWGDPLDIGGKPLPENFTYRSGL
jgi:FlaA1/EpsC-like NDP-sugar epimerase